MNSSPKVISRRYVLNLFEKHEFSGDWTSTSLGPCGITYCFTIDNKTSVSWRDLEEHPSHLNGYMTRKCSIVTVTKEV
jgi:hypothetical protein